MADTQNLLSTFPATFQRSLGLRPPLSKNWTEPIR